MNIQPLAQIRLQNVDDVLQLIPYLVGFTPVESLVIMAVLDRKVVVTARADLADLIEPGACEGLLARLLMRFPQAQLYTLAYTSDHDLGWRTLTRCSEQAVGFPRVLVDGKTWYSSDNETGTIQLGAISDQADDAGLDTLAERADLIDELASAPASDVFDSRADAVLASLPASNETGLIIKLTDRLLTEYLPDATKLQMDDAIALFALALHDTARELALLEITRDNAEAHLALWKRVINLCPDEGPDMCFFLAGIAGWVSGNGAIANIALEKILAEQPDEDHPGRMLDFLITNIVPPSTWTEMRNSMIDRAHPAVKYRLAKKSAED